MRYIFKFPDIGEGLDEGTIVEWYVQKGQSIKSGDALVKMETDKVVTDIPSPKTGIIAAIYGKVGEIIHVGSPLVEIDLPGSENPKEPVVEKEHKETVNEEGAGVVGTLEVAGNNAYLPASAEGFDSNPTIEKTIKKVLSTPVARAFAKDFNIDINKVTGTGPAGRVTKQDIQNYFNKSCNTSSVLTENITHSVQIQNTEVEIVQLSQIRKTIAKNMVLSKHTAAHMTAFEEAEIDELVKLREKFKEKYILQGIKLSYLPFIIKAVALSLKKHKVLNAELDIENNRIIYKKYYNIGIAVDTPDGLVVPVIRNADKLSIKEIAIQVNDFSEKAKDKKLKIEDMKEGTFTITNYGSIGGLFAVPIINFPQVGILGTGRISKRPVIKNDAVVPGTVLPLSISVDHRIVDGGEVTRFLNDVIEYLTSPATMIFD